MQRRYVRSVFDGEAAEQQLVQEFFEHSTNGVFVEVGANEPITRSATWHLEQLGWTGLLVEPVPSCAAHLREQRQARVVEAACSNTAHDGTTARLHVAGGVGEHSSLLPELSEPLSRTGQFVEVRVAALNTLLAEAQIKHIDYLSVDTEGTEIDVFDGLDLERYQPKLILLEDHLRDWSKHRYMTRRGYKLVRRTDFNSWYVPQATKVHVSLFGALQLLRKYVLGVPGRRFRYWRHTRAADRAARNIG